MSLVGKLIDSPHGKLYVVGHQHRSMKHPLITKFNWEYLVQKYENGKCVGEAFHATEKEVEEWSKKSLES